MNKPRKHNGLIGLKSTQMAFDHRGHAESGNAGGLGHSLTGTVHVLALIGFGAWAVLVFRGAAWRLMGGILCAMALGSILGWLGPALPVLNPIAAVWLLSTGLLITFFGRFKPVTATAGLVVMAAVQGYAHGATDQAASDTASFTLGAVMASALLMAVGASLGGAMRVDRAVQAGGLALLVCGVLLLIV